MIKGDKKIISAWSFYDWANSVYPLVISTAIFPNYYNAVTITENSDRVKLFGFEFINSALYSYALAFSFLIIASLSPILSGIADYSGKKKRFMQFFCYLGAFSCLMLYFFSLEHLAIGLLFVMLASIGYSGSVVFYNAFLPEIAEPHAHDKVSARGYALGYFGSTLLLIFNLSMVLFPEIYGIEDKSLPPKIAFITVGIWWAAFAQITFRKLPDSDFPQKITNRIIFNGYNELKKVWKELAQNPQIKKYLASFFVFNMGVQTTMLMATLFGSKVLGLELQELIITIIIIQFVAIAGSFFFAFLSGKIGNFNALAVAILIWIGICIAAFYIYSALHFYMIGATVGFVMGGIQSLSRSTYSKILPETVDHASYFSFYDVCEKLGIVIGMASYGYIEELTGSMRNSVFALMFFFIIGLILLMLVPKKKEIIL